MKPIIEDRGLPRWASILIAAPALILLGPLLSLIALVIRLDTPGPFLYRARRSGRGAKPFTMYKFRTMTNEANRNGTPLTTRGDGRITLSGRWLRKTKMDELPQLINVLKGDMGFVGPRPEDPDIVKKYNPVQKRILRYRPGITSPASLMFRAEEELIPPNGWEDAYMIDILPQKLEMDLRYMEAATALSDLKVILRTVFKA